MKIVVNMNALDKQMFSFNHSKIVDPKNTFFDEKILRTWEENIFYLFHFLATLFDFLFLWVFMKRNGKIKYIRNFSNNKSFAFLSGKIVLKFQWNKARNIYLNYLQITINLNDTISFVGRLVQASSHSWRLILERLLHRFLLAYENFSVGRFPHELRWLRCQTKW